jgi:CRISPR/Cas system-associated exonuclease Cas4 (RecB family)
LPFREAALAVTGIASAASNATKAIRRIIGRPVRRESIECRECRLRVICVGP